MRMQRQRVADKRQLIDVLDKTLLEEAMKLEKVKEGMVSSVEKNKVLEESYRGYGVNEQCR